MLCYFFLTSNPGLLFEFWSGLEHKTIFNMTYYIFRMQVLGQAKTFTNLWFLTHRPTFFWTNTKARIRTFWALFVLKPLLSSLALSQRAWRAWQTPGELAAAMWQPRLARTTWRLTRRRWWCSTQAAHSPWPWMQMMLWLWTIWQVFQLVLKVFHCCLIERSNSKHFRQAYKNTVFGLFF